MVKEFLKGHWAFDLFSLVSIGLIIASFIVPPTGVIDPSVLAATGELFAFAALYVVFVAVQKGTRASVQKGDTTLTVSGKGPDRDRDNF